jgi:hypothetical protein
VRSSQVSRPLAKVRMRKRSVPPVNNCQRFMLAVGPSVRIRSPVAVVLRGLPKNPVYDSMKFYFICSGKFFSSKNSSNPSPSRLSRDEFLLRESNTWFLDIPLSRVPERQQIR